MVIGTCATCLELEGKATWNPPPDQPDGRSRFNRGTGLQVTPEGRQALDKAKAEADPPPRPARPMPPPSRPVPLPAPKAPAQATARPAPMPKAEHLGRTAAKPAPLPDKPARTAPASGPRVGLVKARSEEQADNAGPVDAAGLLAAPTKLLFALQKIATCHGCQGILHCVPDCRISRQPLREIARSALRNEPKAPAAEEVLALAESLPAGQFTAKTARDAWGCSGPTAYARIYRLESAGLIVPVGAVRGPRQMAAAWKRAG